MAFAKKLDQLDRHLCQKGLLRAASWKTVLDQKQRRLYAGELSRQVRQFKTHVGITPFVSSTRNILHDIRSALPLPDGCIEVYQSEDVFEHVPYQDVPAIFDEAYRVLKPGGLFRVSLPDYRCPILLDRSVKDEAGSPIFDPLGGGAYRDGQVVDGGHLWFPVYESVKSLFDQSSFGIKGEVRYLHFTNANGESVLNPIDYSLGFVSRTPDHDERVKSPPRALSIVVDARK